MKYKIWLVLASGVLFLSPLLAQNQPAPPDPTWTGDFGAGLALTSGNSDTTNFNIGFNLLRDPKTRNLMKFDGLYLKGDSDGEDIIDRLRLGFRDEYTLSGRTFLFGQLGYLRDKFKEIDYLLNPVGGIGYKVIRTDSLTFGVDGGAGVVWEKNPGFDVDSSGTINGGQNLTLKLSETASILQNFTSLWKMDDFDDALYHFDIGLAASVMQNVEVKIQFVDDYKTRPPGPEVKKNDQAIITSFIYKF